MDVKKAFDIVIRIELRRNMIENRMLLEYRATITKLYEQVRCQLEMNNGPLRWDQSNGFLETLPKALLKPTRLS